MCIQGSFLSPTRMVRFGSKGRSKDPWSFSKFTHSVNNARPFKVEVNLRRQVLIGETIVINIRKTVSFAKKRI